MHPLPRFQRKWPVVSRARLLVGLLISSVIGAIVRSCKTAARQEMFEITAEDAMNTAFHRGKKPRFTFVSHADIHHGCCNEINCVRRLAQPPLLEVDELLKVCKCLKRIEAPEMAAAVAAVKACLTIRVNFDVTIFSCWFRHAEISFGHSS